MWAAIKLSVVERMAPSFWAHISLWSEPYQKHPVYTNAGAMWDGVWENTAFIWLYNSKETERTPDAIFLQDLHLPPRTGAIDSNDITISQASFLS